MNNAFKFKSQSNDWKRIMQNVKLFYSIFQNDQFFRKIITKEKRKTFFMSFYFSFNIFPSILLKDRTPIFKAQILIS